MTSERGGEEREIEIETERERERERERESRVSYRLLLCITDGDEPLPQAITVQSSYKLNLPPHLIIPSSCIKLIESIGQGTYYYVCTFHLCTILYYRITSNLTDTRKIIILANVHYN